MKIRALLVAAPFVALSSVLDSAHAWQRYGPAVPPYRSIQCRHHGGSSSAKRPASFVGATGSARLRMALESSSDQDASPLLLSQNDIERFAQLKDRTTTIPIIILPDSILMPGQSLPIRLPTSTPGASPTSSSSVWNDRARSFQQMLRYLDETPAVHEIGVLGINPQTQLPMSTGVSATVAAIDKANDRKHNGPNSVPLLDTGTGQQVFELHGRRQFHVLDQPFMDSTGTFHLAHVQLRPSTLPAPHSLSHVDVPHTDDIYAYASHGSELVTKAGKYHRRIPVLVKQWYQGLRQRFHKAQQQNKYSGVSFRHYQRQLRDLQRSIGPMPHTLNERAFWVASMLHPTPNVHMMNMMQNKWPGRSSPLSSTDRRTDYHRYSAPFSLISDVSRVDIRPAMLACRTDVERSLLATTALESSIQYMTE